MNRRRFLQLLGVAPLAFDAHRVIFDMGANLYKLTPVNVELVYNVPLWLQQVDMQALLDKTLLGNFYLSHTPLIELKETDPLLKRLVQYPT